MGNTTYPQFLFVNTESRHFRGISTCPRFLFGLARGMVFLLPNVVGKRTILPCGRAHRGSRKDHPAGRKAATFPAPYAVILNPSRLPSGFPDAPMVATCPFEHVADRSPG